MKKILNLTQHLATPEQHELGVVEPKEFPIKEALKILLTFEEAPSKEKIAKRAFLIAKVAQECISEMDEEIDTVMIGGAPFLMSQLEHELTLCGLNYVYAFSKPIVEEVYNEDGSVSEKTVFKFEGFV